MVPAETVAAETVAAETVVAAETTAVVRATRTYLDHLAVERGLSPNTLSAYRRDLSRYLAFLASRGVHEPAVVASGDVAEFLTTLREPGLDGSDALSPASAARTLVAVRGLHAFWLREALTPIDAAASVKPPALPRRLPKALPVETVIRMLEAAGAAGDAPALRNRALLELLYGTGARVSEAVGLDLDDLDLEGRAVLLSGKGGKQRVLPLGSYAVEAIGAYLVRARPMLAERLGPPSGQHAGAVFLNTQGRRLSRQSAWLVIRAAAGLAGVGAAVSPHTLRHSFATHLLDGGADVRVVQELLGHASVTTTQVYTLVTIDKLREVYATAHPRALA